MSNESNLFLSLFENFNVENIHLQSLIKTVRKSGCSNVVDIVKLLRNINSHYGKSEEADVHLLKLLKYVMDKLMHHYSIGKLPNEVFELIFDDSMCECVSKTLKSIFKTTLHEKIKKVNLEDLLSKTKNRKMQENLLVIIMECYCLQNNEELFTNHLIPTLFKTEKENFRIILLETALKYKEQFPVNLKNKNQVEVLKNDCKNTFVPVMKNLQEKGNAVWQKLWIFLIQYMGKLLHNSKIVNPCLQIVESAFRSQDTKEKLRAFDCWKELINNYSLDFNYLTNCRQINLLMIPLRVTTSKQQDVIAKKSDTWIHLLKMSKSVKCIEKFLQFSFGYKCNDKYELPGEVAKDLGIILTLALLEIIGHKSEKCDCINKNHIFIEPIVNEENFQSVEDAIIYSVLKCCMHLHHWVDMHTYNKVLQCLCTNINILIKNSNSIVSSFKKIIHWLTNLVKIFDKSEFVKNFIDTFISVFNNDKDVLREVFVIPLLKILLTLSIPKELFRDTVLSLMELSYDTKNIEEFLIQIMPFIKNIDMKSAKNDLAFLLWMQVGKMCTNATLSNGPENVLQSVVQFLSWPLLHFQYCTEKDDVLCVWTELFQKSSQEEKRCSIKEFQTKLTNNPLLKSDILVFLLLVLKNDCIETEELLITTLRVCNTILSFPNLSVQDLDKAISILYNSVNLSIKEVTASYQNNILEEVCKAVTSVLQKQQFCRGLECLECFIQKVPKNKYKIIQNMMGPTVENLCLHEDYNVNKIALRILSYINSETTEKNTELISPRSLKMVNMVETNKVSTSLKSKWSSELSPSVKRQAESFKSQATKRNKKSNKPIKIGSPENDDSAYVVINSEVKINEKKMSRRQRELLKKCRDDIPALYQDLSQSQTSNNISQSLSCSMLNDISSLKEVTHAEKSEPIVGDCFKNIVDKTLNCSDEKTRNDFLDKTIDTTESLVQNPFNIKNIINNDIEVLENLKEKLDTTEKVFNLPKDSKTTSSEISRNESSGEDMDTEQKVFKNEFTSTVNKKNRKLMTDVSNNNEERNIRMLKELNRLKMDIVGGNAFLIDGKRQRRSKFDTATEEKKIKTTRPSSPAIFKTKSKSKAKRLKIKGETINSVINEESFNGTAKDFNDTINAINDSYTSENIQKVLENVINRDKSDLAEYLVEKKDGENDISKKISNTSEEQNNENSFIQDVSTQIQTDEYLNENFENKASENCLFKNNLTENIEKQESSIVEYFDGNDKNRLCKDTKIIEMNTVKGSPEDIIECSQKKPYIGLKATYNNKISILKSYDKKINDSREDESVIDCCTTLTHYNKEINGSINGDLNITITASELADCEKDTETCDPNASVNYEFEIKLNVGNNVLNESDKELCNLDTESISSPNECNIKLNEGISSSPETVSTPTRNSELLQNTLNISPIKCDNVDVICLPAEEHFEKIKSKNGKNDDKCIQNIIENDITFLKSPSSRSAKLFGLVSNNVPKNCLQSKVSAESACRKAQVTLDSPKTNRIKKMMSNCEKQKMNSLVVDDLPSSEYLIFTRDVPSSFAIPKTSILKRKRNDLNEDIPSPKRKKVNFSDPLTTCEKLIELYPLEYVSDGDEALPEDFVTLSKTEKDDLFKKAKVKRKNKKSHKPICGRAVRIKEKLKSIAKLNSEANNLELNEIHDDLIKNDELLLKKRRDSKDAFIDHCVNVSKLINFGETIKEADYVSDNEIIIDSIEPKLHLKENVMKIEDIKTEVYPVALQKLLVNCETDIEEKMKSLPDFYRTVIFLLKHMNISTESALSKLSNQTLCKLPMQFTKINIAKALSETFEQPKILNYLEDALMKYQNDTPIKIQEKDAALESHIDLIKNDETCDIHALTNTSQSDLIRDGHNYKCSSSGEIFHHTGKPDKLIEESSAGEYVESREEKVNAVKRIIGDLPVDEEFEDTARELFFALANKMDKTLLEKLFNEYLSKCC